MFGALGLSVGRCFAYIDDDDNYVRINGDIYCNETWEEGFRLRVKANLYNEDDEIVHVDYDFDKKTFLKVGYETFSISCYKEGTNLKYVEVYPKVEKIVEGEDD